MKELAAALMAAQANWINPAGGAWTDAANWEDGHIPVAGDEVTITGLNSDAVITVSGVTATLDGLVAHEKLVLDGSNLTVEGDFSAGELSLINGATLTLTAGNATISGDLAIADVSILQVEGATQLTQTAGAWALSDTGKINLAGTATFEQRGGTFALQDSSVLHVRDSAVWTISGGEYRLSHGGTTELFDSATLNVTGGTMTLLGGEAIRSNQLIEFTGGTLAGSGRVIALSGINFGGVLSPGEGSGGTGKLIIEAQNSSDVDQPINFTGSWQAHLDLNSTSDFDQVELIGTVAYGGTGGITLDASTADFSGSASGTAIDANGGPLKHTGTLTGPVAGLTILPGATSTVDATMSAGGALTVETYAPINPQWISAAGGDWSDSANWQNGRLPVAGDAVVITGLNSDATLSLTGDTPVLASLSLDGGTLAITGGLNTGDLTVTGSAVLTIEGAAASAITGDVSFATGTSFTVKSGGDLTWSGATWTQGGFAQITAGGAFTQTAGRLEISATEQFAVNGTLNLNGGEFVVPTAGSALNLYNSGRLNVTGATLTLSGGTVSAYNETIVTFTNGVLSGAGTFKVNHQLNFAGSSVIKVGGAGTTGTLNFTQGEDATDGAISFADTWAIQLDVLSSSSYDVLSFDSSVTFGASGAIAINAAGADFTGLDEGTVLGDALTVNGAVTGTPTVNVTAGETFSVNTTWSGTALAMTTVGSGVVDSGGSTVAAGITAATSTMQAMLSDFNLGTINFAGQGRTAFALPTLPSALADLFNLSAVASLLDLPGIGSASTTPEAITALENAGYTVTTPGGGVDLLASLTRTVSTDLAPSGTNFTAPAQFLAGIADTLDITAAFSLTASLIQHVVFELRDGVFNLLPDTYLALALAGGATLAGNVRQGDRTVSVTGSTTFTDAEVRVINASGGATATATGVIGVSLTLQADPVTLTYQQDSTLTRTTDSLTTSVSSTSTLSGTLELPAVKDSEGHAAVFALTGTVAGDGQSWTLTGSGSNVEWLAFNVSEWSFDVSLNAGTFSGSGSFTTALDFLSNSGAAPEVALSASFNQDTVSFTGTLNAAEIAVTNPAGGTYLSIADFSSTTSVSANLSTGEWSGTLTFNGGESSFAPAGAAFTATITDGDDADAFAVMGSYDFSSQAFSTSVDQFAIVAENIVSVVSAGVTLRHQRNVTEDQELVKIEHVAVSLLFLKNQPSTGPPTAEAASISIRTNGITIGAGSLTTASLNLGSVLSASQVEVAFTEFAFLDGTVATDSVTFSAESATLFPEGGAFTASATSLSGTYDFSKPTDRLALSAGALSFDIDGLVNFSASDVTLRPEGDTIFSAATMRAHLPAFGVSGEISGLEISSAGTASATAFSIDTSGIAEKLGVGGVLPFGIDGIAVKFLGDTNDNGIRDDGEVFRLDSFDLTVNGHFDFAAMASLPFTPIIKVGENEFDDAGDSLSLEVRVVEGSPQVWNTPTITLGVADLKIGNVVELGGTVTLGGYTDGVWGGTFGGSITMTSLNANVTASASATVDGTVDVTAKKVTVNTEATLNLGIADTITLNDAALTLDFTITDTGATGLKLEVSEATASVGMLKVGTIFEASEVTASMTDLTVSGEGVSLGAISLSAASATLLPEAEGITATTTGFSGRYDFGTDPDTFELTAETVHFALAGVVSLEATEVSITPTGETVFAVASGSATLDGFDSSATVTDFEVARDGTPTAGAIAINTEGLADSLNLGGVLPFNIAGITVAAPEEGGRISFRNFDLTVSGTFDFGALGALPFTPVIRIGAQEADDGGDAFSFTVRMQEGVLTPWDLGPIELGVTNLKMGDALNFGGTIRLGGYAEGAWVPSVGGTLTLGATATTKNLSGEVTVAIDGSWTESTGVLNLTASFTVSFQMGDYVEVTDANIGLNLSLTTRGAEGAFQLGVGQFAVEKASIASVTVTFGSVLSMSATDATFDFAATGSAELLSVGSLQATLTGLGIGGEARNFAIGADGSLQLGDEFGVSLQLGEGGTSTIKWPSWIPLQVTLFDIQWKNLNEDPLNFTLRVSGSVSTEGLSGSKLTLAGSVSNLIIDVGLLKEGAFPIIGLGDVGIAVGGKIAGSKVAAALLLGVLRVDASGHVIGDADTTTPVAQRVLWGAVQGAIDIAGYGGFEIYLGISQYGPLQGFIKASAPVPIDVTGLTGLALTGFRGGITFNSELPAVTDPKELANNPEFKPTATLTFNEWRTLMLNSLAKQVGSASDGGLLAILQNPFRIEGGVTVFSLYASKAAFNVDGDFIMDSTGKFLVRGAFEIGGTISFTANLYVDISKFVTEGNATILFYAELPSEFPVATIYGSLIFDFGQTIDPDNPPGAPFEQFTIKITGGIELGIDGLPKATVDGEANLEVALNAPSLHVTLTGKASIEKLGDLIGVAGDLKFFFGADKTVQAVGIIAMTPADLAQLSSLGLTLDGIALLRFNTTAEAVDYTLTIPGQSAPRTFTVNAGEAGVQLEGVAGLAPAGQELFRLQGVLSMSLSTAGWDVLVDAVLTAGAQAAPLLKFEAQGYLKLVLDGINVGMAAKMKLSLDTDDDALARAGLQLDGSYEFLMNTTGQDVNYSLPSELAEKSEIKLIHLPRGPPVAEGEPAREAGNYLIVRAEGSLSLDGGIAMAGTFDFTVADGLVQMDYHATIALKSGETTFLSLAGDGHWIISSEGVAGTSTLELDGSTGIPSMSLGFSFEATFALQINTTGSAQTVGETQLEAGNYARLRASGDLVVGDLVMTGIYDLRVDSEGVAVTAKGSVDLGVAGVVFYTFGFEGGLLIREDGIFTALVLSVESSGRDTYGFGFGASASYTLNLNTTADEIEGVPAGLGARVKVEGALEIGDWKLDGVYTLTATTTGIGFAASAAMIFRDGGNELFRLPVEFAIELKIPGIAERIALDIDPSALGLEIPGFDLAGSFHLEINTTPNAVNGIPAGPILRAGLDGTLTLGTLSLEGAWFFDGSLSRTQIGGAFSLSLGVPGSAPMITWAGEADFNLGLNGVAGFASLTVENKEPPMDGLLPGDFNFELLVNTSPSELKIGDRTLPPGPLAAVKSSGTLNVGGLDFTGEFNFSASPAGINITMDATLDVKVGDAIRVFSFATRGGFAIDAEGISAAMDLTLRSEAWSEVGLQFSGGADYHLRINTTGRERTIGGVTLAAGHYTRVEFRGAVSVGTFSLSGDFMLSTSGGTADLALNGVMEARLPGSGSAAFRLGAIGGLRIDSSGVAAAFDLDSSLTGGTIHADGVEMPIGAEQTVSLRLNTTGAERTVGGIVLEAGNYFALRTTGQLVLGPYVLSGEFGFVAADTGFSLDARATLGIGVADVQFMRFSVLGKIQVSADGTFASLTLASELGDGFGEYGFGFGAGARFTLASNATNAEIDGIPAHSPWALRVAGTLAMGGDEKGGELTGSFTLTPTADNTLMLHGETNFVLRIDGTQWVEVPFSFDYEIETPGLAFRIDLSEEVFDSIHIPGVTFGPGEFYLQFNAGPEPVAYTGETIPAGPVFELVYTGTLKIGWAALDGSFRFSASGDGVAMDAALTLRFGDSTAPFLQMGGEGAFQVSRDGFSGRLALTVSGGVDAVKGPMGDNAITHELYLNTRDTAVVVSGVELPAGPTVELRSTGALNLFGLSFVGLMRTTGSGGGFSMGVDAKLEIKVPVVGTTLLSIPVLGGFTISSKGFSAALDVFPSTTNFEPVGLLFGGDASYRLRINTTGEARQENGIGLDAGKYARVEASGTMSLGLLRIEGGYSFQVESGLVRVGVTGAAILTVPGEGAFAGELLRTEIGGEFGIGSAGVVGALDSAVGAGAPQFALGDWSLPVGVETGSRIRLNTTGSERTVAGYTMAANETFMWEVSGGVTLGALRMEGLDRFTAGHDLVRLEHTGRVALMNPRDGAAEILAGEGTLGIEISDAGVAGVATLAGAPTKAGALDLGIGLDMEAAIDLRFNTTGKETTLGDVTLGAGNYFEAGVTGVLQLLGQRIDGTHVVRVADGAVSMRSAGTLTFGVPDVLTMTFGTDINFVFAGDGVYGTAALSVGTAAFSAQGADLVFAAGTTPVFAINTSSTAQTAGDSVIAANSVSLGLGLDLTLLGQRFSGQAVLTVDGEQGLVVLRHAGALAPAANGWSPFVFHYDGYFVFGEKGVLTQLDLTLAGGAGVEGVAFNGDWSLQAGSLSSRVDLAAFEVGGLSVPAIHAEAGQYFRTRLEGSLTVGGLAINGNFDLAATSVEFAVTADASVSFFGVTAALDGLIYLHRDRGFVANVGLSWGGIDNSLMRVSGSARLQINTWSGVWEEVNPNTVSVTVSDATLGLLGFNLTGSMAFVWQDGVATLRADNLTLTPVPGLTTVVSGQVDSAGNFDFTGTSTITLGDRNFVGISGSLATRFNNSGFSSELDGRIDLLRIDHTTVKGSVSVDGESLAMSLDMGRVKLLGDALILSGRIEAYRVSDGRVGFNVSESNPLKLEVLGGAIEATVSGYIWSDGKVNLNGSATLNIGDANFVKLSGALDVHVSNSGFSATLDGRIDLLGLDYTTVKGSVAIDGESLAMSLEMSRVKLLGDALIISGRIEAYRESDGRVGFNVSGSNPLKLEVLGGVIEATVSGYIWSDGKVNLNGTAALDLGDSTLGVKGTLAIQVTNSGISGSANGTFFVPGDYNTFSGSFAAGDWGFDLTVDRARFVLLGNAVLLDGGMRIEMRDSELTFRFNDISVESRIPGFTSKFTVDGWISSRGEFDLRGTAAIDVGNTTLGIKGSIAIRISHEGISGSANGTFYVPGDYNSFSGSFAAGSWGFDLTVDRARFVLLGNAVLLDGGMKVELRNGLLSFYLNDVSVESRIPGFTSKFTVDGFIKSDGTFDLNGTAAIDAGDSTLGVKGDIAINLSQDGISGSVVARMYVPGDYADFKGSFEAGKWGFNLTVYRARFALLGGLVILDGGFKMELRNSTLTFYLNDISAELRLSGFSQTFGVTGWINSAGRFNLDGTTKLDIGNSTIGATGTLRVNISDQGVSGSVSGRVYFPGDYANFSGSFEAGTWGFNLKVDRVRFVVAGGAILLDGSLLMELRGSTFTLYVDRVSVEMWGLRGEVSGWFESNSGRWQINGSVSFYYGGDFGAQGKISIEVGHDRTRLYASGTAWAQKDYWFFGWHTYRDWARIEANIDINSGRADVTIKLWKFYFTLKVRLRGGFAIWLSDVGGSTVFLDVNRNGVLDANEPSTVADANGDFNFAEDFDPDQVGNEVSSPAAVTTTLNTLGLLATYDRNGDGALDSSEIRLYAVNGIAPSTASDLRRLYRDANGNGVFDASERYVDVSYEEITALDPSATTVTGTPLVAFDDNGDGELSAAESANFQLAIIGDRVPLTAIDTAVSGGLPVSDADFVFADANGNGVYDAGEIRVTPDENNVYTFMDASVANTSGALGRLAPFDTNGNGKIDSSEGVFVVLGGTDNDSGVTNTIAAVGLADGYGGGIEKTLSPLTALQVSLVDHGLSSQEAEDLIEDAFNLHRDVDIDTYDPIALTNGDSVETEAGVLSAGAQVSALITGGASLLGDGGSAALQDAVLDSLAKTLVSISSDPDISINLTDSAILTAVLESAGSQMGQHVDSGKAAAAATVLSRVNEGIIQTASQGGDVDRALAANKAVFLGKVNTALAQLGSGQTDAATTLATFTAESLAKLASQVALTPTAAPTVGTISDVTSRGGDVVRVVLPVSDPDSRLGDLKFTVTSSDAAVVDGDAVTVLFNGTHWVMSLPTAAVSSGTTTISVVGSDGSAQSGTSFKVTLDGVNPAVQQIRDIPTQTLSDGDKVLIDLGKIFSDPDGNATYTLTAVGPNQVVAAQIVAGKIELVASTGLTGVAIFDLKATDDTGSVTTRFSVVTYPIISVGQQIHYNANGQAGVLLTLSSPSTQSLALSYRSGSTVGSVLFTAGETTQFIPVDIPATASDGSVVRELQIGLTGTWVSGEFTVGLNTYSAVELMGLRRDYAVSVQFTLSYLFVDPEKSEDGEILLTPLGTVDGAEGPPPVVSVKVTEGSGEGTTYGGDDLIEATSLDAWSQPRQMSGI